MTTFSYKRRLGYTYHLLALFFCGAPLTAYAQIPSTEDYKKEYRANWGLAAINANAAYKIGITGQGIKVGIVDTGVSLSHPEFVGREHLGLHMLLPDYFATGVAAIADGGVAAINDGGSLGFFGHGTHVAGIMVATKDGRGMHGVAYNSHLISATAYPSPFLNDLAINNNTGDRQADFQPFPLLAIKDTAVRVINHSWGNSDWAHPIEDLTRNFEHHVQHPIIQAIANIANQSILQVWAAGNGGYESLDEQGNVSRNPSSLYPEGYEALLPHFIPSVKDYWLSVIATDQDNRIVDSSNYCGIAMDWCLAAPGKSIYSTVLVGRITEPSYSYEGKEATGTSMAAPHVTGAVALAMQRFPYMDNKQIREVILTTANNSGHLSNSAIYGQGLLDIAKAMQGPGKFRQDWVVNLPNNPCADLIDQTCNVWTNDISGLGGLTKTGAGTLTLSGNNTYSGITHVQAGQLNITGQMQQSRLLQIDHGATLRGTGFINSPTIISGILAPGNSAGTLTFFQPLTMTSSSQTLFDINGIGTANGAGNYSRVRVLSAMKLGGALQPRLRGIEGQATNALTPRVGDRFAGVLFAQEGFVGGFDTLAQPEGLTPGSRFDIFFNGNQADLSVASTALPGSRLGDNAAAGAQVLNALRDTPMALRPGAYNSWLAQAVGGQASEVTYRAMGGQIYADSTAWGMSYQDYLGQILFGRLAGVGSGKTARTSSYSLWMEAPYRTQAYSASPSRLDTQGRFGGVLLGLERQFERLQVGAALGIVDGRITQDVARMDMDGYSFSVYGRYALSGAQQARYRKEGETALHAGLSAYVEHQGANEADVTQSAGPYVVGRLSYASLNARSQRSLPALATTLNSQGQQYYASAELGIGTAWWVRQWQINPELRLQYTHSQRDGVDESGVNPNDPFALSLEGSHVQRTSAMALLHTSRRIALGQGYVVPQMTFGVQRNIGATPTSMARLSNLANLYGQAGPWSIQQSAAVDERTLFRLGLGVQWQHLLSSAKVHVDATTSSLGKPSSANTKALEAGVQWVRRW